MRRHPITGALALGGLLTIALTAFSAIGLAQTAAQQQYAPTNTARPTISDTTPQVGQQLTAAPGTWTGDQPIVFTYQWQRCNPGGQQCVNVPNADDQTYTVVAADENNTLRVEVRASNASGTGGPAFSDPTSRVGPAGPPPPPPTGPIPVSAVSPPNRLLIDRVQFTPNPIRSRTAPVGVRVRVLEVTTGRPVSGALVFLRSTPVVTTTPDERGTDANGFVTFTIQPERDFRIVFRRGYNLQFFVRARKPGDNVLAGVSTRRLVQVGISPRR
jgi:hypothetical protein